MVDNVQETTPSKTVYIMPTDFLQEKNTLPDGLRFQNIFSNEKSRNFDCSYDKAFGPKDNIFNLSADYSFNSKGSNSSQNIMFNTSSKAVLAPNILLFTETSTNSDLNNLSSDVKATGSFLSGFKVGQNSVNTSLCFTPETICNGSVYDGTSNSTDYKTKTIIDVLHPINEQSTFQGAVYYEKVQGTDESDSLGTSVGILSQKDKNGEVIPGTIDATLSYDIKRTPDANMQEYYLAFENEKVKLSAGQKVELNANPTSDFMFTSKLSKNKSVTLNYSDNGCDKTYNATYNCTF